MHPLIAVPQGDGLIAIHQDQFTFVAPPEGMAWPLENPQVTASFVVNYSGFTPEAQAAFQHAVNIWSNIVVSSVPIVINANWTPLGAGVLGSAGPTFIYRDFLGAPETNTVSVCHCKRAHGHRSRTGSYTERHQRELHSAFPNWFGHGCTLPGSSTSCRSSSRDWSRSRLHRHGTGGRDIRTLGRGQSCLPTEL
jgi:hypothetical protein